MKQENKNNLLLLLALIPIGFYCYLLQKYAINIPYFDDHALKAFILNYEKAPTFTEKLQTLFQQHNEHRIVITRFFTLLTYWINGSIDYTWLMWIGNTSLIGIVYFFYKTFTSPPAPLLAGEGGKLPSPARRGVGGEVNSFTIHYSLFTITCLLFTQMLWENTYWGMASVQNFGVIFFVIGLFYFLSKDGTKDFNRAILFAILATFTSGNGFLALPIALFLLILQKENKRAIQFSIVSILLAFVYFYHYKSPENPPFHGTIKEYSKAFLAFLGNLADFKPNAILTLRMKYLMLTGTGIFVLSILYGIKLLIQSPIFTKKIDKQNHFYFGILLFLLASALIVVVGRMGFGVQTMLTSRYKIYSILLVIVLYCLLIQWTNYKKWISQIAFGLALIFNIWMNFQYFEEVIYQRNRLISFDFNASYTNFSGNRQFDAKVPYTAPKQFYDGKFVQIVNQLKDTTQINKTLEIKESNENITIKSDSTSGSSFISLISDKQLFLFPTRQNCAATRSFFLKDGIYFANGFTANIDKNDLPSGTYLLGLVQEDEDNLTATNLNKTILVEKNQTKKKVNW